MMNLTFDTTKHKNINTIQLNDICLLKDENWVYGLNNQIKWINENINPEDFHLLCYDDELVGYTNLVHRTIVLDSEHQYRVLGIGNVCVSKKQQGLGLGSKLIEKNNEILLNKNEIGILLCKNELVKFYKKNGWALVDDLKLGSNLKSLNTNIMTFNLQNDFNSIELIGHSF